MATKTQPPPAAAPAQPPDEKFWVKYSRHHELPISGMASLAWHTLIIGFIVIVAWVITAGARDEMPIEVVSLSGDAGSGGLNGTGADRNIGNGSPRVEAVEASQLPPDAQRPTDPLQDIPGLKITPKDLLKEVEVDQEADRDLIKITEHGTRTLQQLAQVDKQIREKLLAGIGNGTPGGKGGSGGGPDGGSGTEAGPGTRSARAKRTLRWFLRFNTESGTD